MTSRRFSTGRVTHASRAADSRGKEFDTYHIEVDMETAGEHIEKHEVTRRFSEFATLDAAIRRAVSPSKVGHLPVLPSAFSLNKFSEGVVAHRRTILDKYVRSLLTSNDPEITNLPDVIAFFSPAAAAAAAS